MTMKADKFKLDDSLRGTKDLKSLANSITNDIHGLGGVNAARFDPIENTVTVDYNEGEVSLNQIQQKLKEGNYLK
ncbi:hypothetical protein GOQ27_12740 [Clostridium sp. D2Q-11]|uniref:Copper chaperone CopZ n=1 Tax=Anaeromonas frigoriresistens TaxID=2683708 RepID=A0A942UXE5_9FIRM|nr:hypothetical protein [Anaeromonas frigoriresistens]MBS4539335.1 hypothetical protein [Anaeromonas frigoriresistens]